jgi:transcriptional regulator with XRE-family HTH domain
MSFFNDKKQLMPSILKPSLAALIFKKSLREKDLTQKDFSKKTGISPTALTKFTTGLRLTPDLLTRLLKSFPEPIARQILIGHLHDEVKRAGMDPETFYIIEREPDVFIVRGDLTRLNAVDKSIPSVSTRPKASSTPPSKLPSGHRDIDS